MKRFTAITLVLMLIFAFTISAAAQPSPIVKEYYKISVSTEGSGNATATPNKVEIGSDETVVLTATNDKGYFHRWILNGDYEILDGKTVSDPVITVKISSDLDATANFGVDPEYLYMTAEAVTPGHDTAEVDIPKVLKGSDTVVTFTATEVDCEFIEWEFQCDFKLVSGDLKSKVVKIIPYTDVHGIAYFETGSTPPKPDDSDTSPKTGETFPYAVIPFMALALGAAILAAMKLKKA